MFSEGAGAARPKRSNKTKNVGGGAVVEKDWGMYDEIIEMLLAAGYFRVRIAGLSEFDKVIGGLCWCITSSLEALDVDIFFQENPSIGQKLKISESVVAAVNKMECKYSLEPHQIQGEDFRAIYPVLQWLVKKVMAVRKTSTARMFAEASFQKAHTHPQDIENQQVLEQQSLPFVWNQKDKYAKTVRRFRRTEKVDFSSEEAHVQYVLLEYGDHTGAAADALGSDGQGAPGEHSLTSLKDALTAGEDAGYEEEDEEEQEEDLIDEDMKAKLAGAKASGKVNSKGVGGLVGLGSDAIRQAANDYTLSQEEADALQARLAGGLLEALQRQLASLQKQVDTHEQRHNQLQGIDEELKKDVAELLAELKRRGEENERMSAELEQMEGMKTAENQVDLERLRALVMLNEAFKQQEQRFKEGCKAQRDSLVAKIQSVGVGAEDPNSEEEQRLRQIEETYVKDLDKFTRVRQMLAKKNQEVAFVQRRIEEVPTRTELTQYERRFVELYEQVASKLEETRKYFETFNNLQDRRGFYGQELELMNQIYEQYAQISTNKAQKQNYTKEMARIRGEIEGSVQNIQKKVAKRTQERDLLHDHYNSLQEKQRAYYKACREFQEECDKNEYLLSVQEGQQAA